MARALACTFANVFAGAIDAQTPGVAYACSDTLVITGYGAVCTLMLAVSSQSCMLLQPDAAGLQLVDSSPRGCRHHTAQIFTL